MKKIKLVFVLFVVLFIVLGVFSFTSYKKSEQLESEVGKLQSQLAAKNQKQESTTISGQAVKDLQNQIDTLQNDSLEYKKEVNKLLRTSLTPPYTSVQANQLVTAFTLTEGTLYTIQTPLPLLIEDIVQKADLSSTYSYKNIDLNGFAYSVVDMVPFVDPAPFTPSIQSFAQQFPDDEQLITEIWYMVTQFNTYLPEIGENPQTPLETLFLATGDCEDSSILIASLLKAVPRDWEVSFIYTDYDNPTNPMKIDHILVSVDTGVETYFIETTNQEEMNPHGEVKGYKLVV